MRKSTSNRMIISNKYEDKFKGKRVNENDKEVIIYAFAKVASKTLEASLDALQIHFHYVFRKLNWQNKFIINVVRNPLERNLSLFFHNICNSNDPYWYLGTPPGVRKMKMEYLITRFRQMNEVYCAEVLDHWYPNLEKNLGIRLTDYPFTGKRTIIEKDGCRILFIRFEDLGEWETILREYFPNLKLKPTHLSQHKWYNDLYQEFKKKFRYNNSEIQQMMQPDYVKHFYSQSERNLMIQKWKISADSQSRVLPEP